MKDSSVYTFDETDNEEHMIKDSKVTPRSKKDSIIDFNISPSTSTDTFVTPKTPNGDFTFRKPVRNVNPDLDFKKSKRSLEYEEIGLENDKNAISSKKLESKLVEDLSEKTENLNLSHREELIILEETLKKQHQAEIDIIIKNLIKK